MITEQKLRRAQKQYLVTTICSGEMKDSVITATDRAQLDANDVDVHIDEPRAEIWIRHRDKESSIKYPFSKIKGFGGYEQKLLADAIFSAGDIVKLKSGRYINQRIARLRRLFADSKTNEFFLKTTNLPYSLAINTERNWRYVEVLAELALGSDEQG